MCRYITVNCWLRVLTPDLIDLDRQQGKVVWSTLIRRSEVACRKQTSVKTYDRQQNGLYGPPLTIVLRLSTQSKKCCYMLWRPENLPIDNAGEKTDHTSHSCSPNSLGVSLTIARIVRKTKTAAHPEEQILFLAERAVLRRLTKAAQWLPMQWQPVARHTAISYCHFSTSTSF